MKASTPLLAATVGSFLIPFASAQNVLTVSGSVPGLADYSTIAAAVAAASAGDIIRILDSEAFDYYENLDITTPDLTISALFEGMPNITFDPTQGSLPTYLIRLDNAGGQVGNFKLDGVRVSGAVFGGMLIQNCNPVIEDCTFGGNYLNFGGSAIQVISGSPQIRRTTFSGNGTLPPGVSGLDCLRGGAILYENPGAGLMPLLENCSFYSNVAFERGGAVAIEGSGAGGLDIVGCMFGNNIAAVQISQGDLGGGAIYDASGGSGVFIGGLTEFHGNSSGRFGGAILGVGSDTRVELCLFENNQAEQQGGGVCHMDGNPTYNTCVFGDPASPLSGGNNASRGGGAAILQNAYAVFGRCFFYGNGASQYGAGGYTEDALASFSQCQFVQNGQSNFDPQRGGGLAVFFSGMTGTGLNLVEVFACTFRENYAAWTGAGMAIAQIDAFGEPVFDGSPILAGAEIRNCSFDRNGEPELANGPTVRGAGIDVELACAEIELCEMLYNRAYETGAAIELQTAHPLGFVRNCLLARNTTNSGSGAGIHGLDSPVPIVSCTIARNNAPFGVASGVHLEYQAFVGGSFLDNTIVWNNAGPSTSPQLLASGVMGSTVTARSSDISDVPSFGWVDGGGNLSVLPRFVSPANDDFHLKLSSPLVNAGNKLLSLLSVTDLDLEARILNGEVDMGADEVRIPINAGGGTQAP